MTPNRWPVEAVAVADEWFSSLGRPFLRRLSLNDPLLIKGSVGWLVSTLGRELAVIVDAAFPFTRPKVYLRGDWPAMPHVERDGRLCLKNPEIPTDPAASVARALGEARALLRAIARGTEENDFQEDLGLYWRQKASSAFLARLLLSGPHRSSVIASTVTGAAIYGFSSPQLLRKWWMHRFGMDRMKVRQGALIVLNRLPDPHQYPRTGAELWDLIITGASEGGQILNNLLRQKPKSLLIILAGKAPSSRSHAVGIMLTRHLDTQGRPLKRRVIEHCYGQARTSSEIVCNYQVRRLETQAIDAAGTRLPYAERDHLAAMRVAVVGCGALGSGVARLLAKSGVGHLLLVDPETLSWENIRRHQLGASCVGLPKATALAKAIARENPDIGSTQAHDIAIEKLLAADPTALASVNLVVACTATWSANSVLDETMGWGAAPPVLYAWMEAHALAAHAVLITPGHSYQKGYDEVGNAKITASISNKLVPVECGGLTSPFGAIELSQAEALTARVALDFLRGKISDTTWKTWLTDAATLADAEGAWTTEWIRERGNPDPLGQISVGSWWRT